MTTQDKVTITLHTGTTNTLLIVLLFGSLWGAVEALFGGLLHVILPPTYQGKIMIALAIALMAIAVRQTRKPWIPFGMALIAAPLKLFSAVVFSLPISAPAILNPVFSILAQGAAFALFAMAVEGRRWPVPLRLAVAGTGAGALQSLLFAGLVRGPGQLLYLPLTAIKELGTKFPYWSLSLSGIGHFLSTSVPYSALAAGAAAIVIGVIPVRAHTGFRPAFVLTGSALCLGIFFLASWFI